MRLLDSLTVSPGPPARTIELYQGDLADLRPDEAVDVLVVSAFPDSYAPSPSTLIGALDRRGLSVEELSDDKAIDLRETHSCWISHPLRHRPPGIEFDRLLCFEPHYRGEPAEVVGDIFRCLVALVADRSTPVRSVAMPLVSAGLAGESPVTMFRALMNAAVHWMALPDFPLERLKIAVYRSHDAAELREDFLPLSDHFRPAIPEPPRANKYDLFVSYCRKNDRHARLVIEELKRLRPGVRIFFDQMSLQAGASFQQEIYEAVESCHTFVALYSPEYLQSKVCLEEFHLAKFCNRESGAAALVPLYLFTAPLPAYMRMLQYIDCREGDEAKVRYAARQLLAMLD